VERHAIEVIISLPEDISESLRGQWGNVSRHALETIAVEGYRTNALSEAQVRRLLRLETRFEVHALLKEHRVPLRYAQADLEEDLAAQRSLGILPDR
jgi:predicted HTH domain antitoxin